MYESSYPGSKESAGRGENDPYIAIDVPAIAEKLECKAELLFGRLYYHLDQKYRYKQDNGALVPLFYLKVGEKRHAIHFPYLAAILSGLEHEHRKQAWALSISLLALVLSVASLVVNFIKK
jgi:hypothetical protein